MSIESVSKFETVCHHRENELISLINLLYHSIFHKTTQRLIDTNKEFFFAAAVFLH
jgi:hypothetical protein